MCISCGGNDNFDCSFSLRDLILLKHHQIVQLVRTNSYPKPKHGSSKRIIHPCLVSTAQLKVSILVWLGTKGNKVNFEV
ncbi:hypothetical protein VNO80_29884 [Phaseolus coccineus]|uniref:Uncharacterized protein n=1 Tax=Phaseolus coccineus TaxID=3886 RepID=A0AAN9LBS0_PHACN